MEENQPGVLQKRSCEKWEMSVLIAFLSTFDPSGVPCAEYRETE